jgi:hypothetical protein
MATETFPFDPAKYFSDPQSRARLIADALETGEAGYIAAALGTAARARGMAQVARRRRDPRRPLQGAEPGRRPAIDDAARRQADAEDGRSGVKCAFIAAAIGLALTGAADAACRVVKAETDVAGVRLRDADSTRRVLGAVESLPFEAEQAEAGPADAGAILTVFMPRYVARYHFENGRLASFLIGLQGP